MTPTWTIVFSDGGTLLELRVLSLSSVYQMNLKSVDQFSNTLWNENNTSGWSELQGW